jgi:hypothetical protein
LALRGDLAADWSGEAQKVGRGRGVPYSHFQSDKEKKRTIEHTPPCGFDVALFLGGFEFLFIE